MKNYDSGLSRRGDPDFNGEEKHIHGKIELPKPKNQIAEQLAQYKTTVKDVRYVLKQYGKQHPEEAFECIEKIVNDPKLKHRGGTH